MAEAPRIDANDFAPGIEQRSAGKSRIQGEVKPNVLIEFSPTPVSPLAADAADDPAARHQVPAPRAAQRQNKMPEPEACRVA